MGHSKEADGLYHIKGQKFKFLVGSRAQVWHGTAYKTSGGLTKNKLRMNKNGRVVSAAKHFTAKREKGKRFKNAGYTLAKKGKFGAVKSANKTRRKK